MRVLLAWADATGRDALALALEGGGFGVTARADGERAVAAYAAERQDLVVLDVALPVVDGFEACCRIREMGRAGIILLSDLREDEHVLRGFRAGADDFLVRPFGDRQLVVRARAIAGRRAASPRGPAERATTLRAGGLELDLEAYEASYAGRLARLFPIEFRLLRALAENAGRVVARGRLVERGWGVEGGSEPMLKTHLSHVRTKLGLPREGPGSIGAIAGLGYRLAV